MPWPLMSVMASPGTKLAVPSIWDSRSGWCRSMPVSSTATFTPLPSNPAAQASGAPICGTLSLRLTCTRPSSQSLATPPRRVGVASEASSFGATVVQNVRVRGFDVFSAAPSMAGSSRTIVLPCGAGGAPAARAVAGV